MAGSQTDRQKYNKLSCKLSAMLKTLGTCIIVRGTTVQYVERVECVDQVNWSVHLPLKRWLNYLFSLGCPELECSVKYTCNDI